MTYKNILENEQKYFAHNGIRYLFYTIHLNLYKKDPIDIISNPGIDI